MLITLAFIVVLIVMLYFYGSKNFDYWEKKGIKHDKAWPFIGSTLEVFLARKSMTVNFTELYWKYKDEKVIGAYQATRPELIIRDPEIARRILTTDFYHFYPRGLNPNKAGIEPMMKNLFFADGDLWRLLRQRMTPAFSSGKLKAMFPLICERAERLQEILSSADTAEGERVLDARDLMARYTTDFIGSCGFGLEANSLNDENSAFRELGKNIFKVTPVIFIKFVLKEVFPKIFKSLRLLAGVEEEIVKIVDEIQRQRNYEPRGRNDFIDLLLECKKKGVIVGESIEKTKPDGTPEKATLEMDDLLMAAQVFIFFAAGFETSSSATSYTLHQLAFHPDVQRKVQEEIDRVLSKYENKLCHDAIKEMQYLEWTFKEGMRMFPSLGFLIRECSRKYTIKELDLTIDPGVLIIIPLQSLQNDPQYFDKPEQFRPERFHPDEFNEFNKMVYMPFGVGPRACIGERLGLMQSLAGLAAVLSKYSVLPAPETLRQPLVDPTANIVQSVKKGLPLTFIARKKKSQ